jgi:hypothetical protein
MTAKAEFLIGHWPCAFSSGMRCSKECHPFQNRLTLLRCEIRINQRVEILQHQRKWTYDAKFLAWNTLHRPQHCSLRWDWNYEPAGYFLCPLL